MKQKLLRPLYMVVTKNGNIGEYCGSFFNEDLAYKHAKDLSEDCNIQCSVMETEPRFRGSELFAYLDMEQLDAYPNNSNGKLVEIRVLR